MKVAPVLLKYAYGKKELGYSLNYQGIVPGIRAAADHTVPFWMDSYLQSPERLHQDLIRFVEKERPDIVFFLLMQDEVGCHTLDQLKKDYTTVHWFGDDTWRFEEFTRYWAPHFSCAVTTDKFSIKKYHGIGYKNVVLSQWAAYDVLDHVDINNIDYHYDVTFVGAYSGHRAWVIRQLRRAGFQVECFGPGWPNGVVSFKTMQEIFLASRVNLNISNSVSHDIRCLTSSLKSLREFAGSVVKKGKKTAEQIKARNFEIPASGGFQLTNYVAEIEDYFHIGHEIAVYSTVEDLIRQVDYYLTNESDRQKILHNGHQQIIGRHTYTQRFKDIFTAIESGPGNTVAA